jgi:soluble lytic murein transglycosylase-like protein
MALDVFIELIPIQETRNYVKLVLRNYLFYKLLDSKGVVQGDVFALEMKQ